MTGSRQSVLCKSSELDIASLYAQCHDRPCDRARACSLTEDSLADALGLDSYRISPELSVDINDLVSPPIAMRFWDGKELQAYRSPRPGRLLLV